jgi:hypothetical protein
MLDSYPDPDTEEIMVRNPSRHSRVKGTPFLEGVSTLYEMCIIVLFVNVLGW